jgi:hypothetical protein
MTRVETVVSELLTALPVIPAEVGGPLLRALGLVDREPADEQAARDFAASDKAGFLETDLDAWYAAAMTRKGVAL